MAIRTTPKVEPAPERALPVEKPKFDKTAYQREYMRKKRAGEKMTVSVRLDADVLARWRASGKGWQDRLNEAVKKLPVR